MNKKLSKDYFNDTSLKNNKIFSEYIKFLRKLNIQFKNKNVLDIGCGAGTFLNLLDKSNKKTGVDISDHIIETAQKKEGEEYFVWTKQENSSLKNFEGKTFDVITMFDVLEHLYNFEYFEKMINNHLKEGGYLVLTTPNANSLLRFILGHENYTGEQNSTHKLLFTPYTLDFFLRRCG